MTSSKISEPRRTFSQPWYFHPLLFGIYPIVALLAANISQIRPEAAIRSFLISFVLAVIVFGLSLLIIKNKSIAAIFSSFLFILFYSYGHVYQLIEGKMIGGLDIGRHRFLGFLWLALLVVGVWLIFRKARKADTFNRLLNTVSIILLVLPLFNIGEFEIRAANVARGGNTVKAASITSAAGKNLDPETLPDVYYIILDGYSRDDILKQLYNYDNSSFYAQLKQLGFVIPDCAQSNYARTALSISSALHMDYIQDFSTLYKQGDQSLDMPVYLDYIQHSPVRSHLAEFGYKMVAFETGYFWNEVTDADVYIIANNNPLEKVKQGRDVSEFEMMYLRTTAFRTVDELKSKFTQNIVKNIRTPEEKHHDQVVFALDQLGQVPNLPGKKFVYAHIVAPHAPFVFSPDGRYISNGAVNPGYLDAISYVNSRIIPIVKSIIDNSKVPPVIIIQGDHGWDADHRMQILNAYYLPDGGSSKIYNTITPVNTFRTVFNEYFGDSFPLLKDVSYFSDDEAPYAFKEIPHTCSSGNPPPSKP
ncbi:hypothetical protein [Leptolinea tardivitalis]|uniref:Sulfatase N-terminal domain-containing protein n=1 Tax=Leptolinea tardivitalis TaxID=229920 RepID=A0A0P6XQD9_9CHLR|nr:hypothetical protein [Leptolinea tardivitalis]KPL71646.1 hypothetical protein ADM99_09195 [Leptolinea tardivitalis]GAP19977.1 hypothetical protein LTAR_00161 [Leptolinea tardivitalis]